MGEGDVEGKRGGEGREEEGVDCVLFRCCIVDSGDVIAAVGDVAFRT